MAGVTLGYKGDMSQEFTEDGVRIPVTSIRVSPAYLVGFKTTQKDGYDALLIGFSKVKSTGKAVQGQTKKAGIETPLRFLKEVRLEDYIKSNAMEIVEEEGSLKLKSGDIEIKIGDEIVSDQLFQKGESIQVTGTSKGKGFAGVVKRHKFKGGQRTHGQSDRLRAPGSIGQGTTPGRVYKGKRMAGRMGSETVTVKNLSVVDIQDGVMKVKGLIPGAKKSLVIIRSMVV